MRRSAPSLADEETVLLPDAQTLLRDRLGELGARMARRRLQLSAPRVPEMARNAVARQPGNAAVMAAGAILAGLYVARRLRHPHA
jgi:hypothetical protein